MSLPSPSLAGSRNVLVGIDTKPTSDVSLDSTHWKGPLADANLTPVQQSASRATATLYVSAAGVDPGPGVLASLAGARGTTLPFATLSAALAVAQPYDRIVLSGPVAIAGAVSVSTANLTISGYGAVLTPPSDAFVNLFNITGQNCTLEGFEVNGLNINNGGVDGGVISVQAPGFRARNLFIHDSRGYGIQLTLNWSNAEIEGCVFTKNYIGVKCYAYPINNNPADPTPLIGASIVGNWGIDNHYGFLRCTNNSGGVRPIMGLQVHRNNVTQSVPDYTSNESLAIELNGGGVVGVPNYPIQDAQVSHNNVSGYSFGISINGCARAVVSENHVQAGSYCGIEFANHIYCSGLNNEIRCPIVLNGFSGQGYAITNNSTDGYNDVYLTIRGGSIYQANNLAFHLLAVNSVLIEDVYMEGTTEAVYVQNCQRVVCRQNRLRLHNTADLVALHVETYSTTPYSTFHFVGNRVIYDDPSHHVTNVVLFNSSSGPGGVANDIVLRDFYTNATTAAAFIGYTNVTPTVTQQIGNYPVNSNVSLGFNDVANFSTLSAGTLTLNGTLKDSAGRDLLNPAAGFIALPTNGGAPVVLGFAGYLYTGTQAYQTGVLSPTGFVQMRDSTGHTINVLCSQ